MTADELASSPRFARSAYETAASSPPIDLSHVVGMGALPQRDRDRTLILVDIQQLMSSPEMGLLGATVH